MLFMAVMTHFYDNILIPVSRATDELLLPHLALLDELVIAFRLLPQVVEMH